MEQCGQLLSHTGEMLADLCSADCEGTQLDQAVGTYMNAYASLRTRFSNSHVSCAVLAMCKSGKSTLINALCGEELLPMNNVPETARICQVIHTPATQRTPFLLEPASSVLPQQGKRLSRSDSSTEQAVVTTRGVAAIHARLQDLNQAMRQPLCSSAPSPFHLSLSPSQHLSGSPPTQQHLSQGAMSEAEQQQGSPESSHGTEGSPSDVSAQDMLVDRNMLAIHTPIAAIRTFSEGSKSSSKGSTPSAMRLQLLDTPGPNEAGEAGLKHQVERLLGTVDACVYLLDYTKLKTEDEASLFEKLKEINPALIRRLSTRLFIAVNKFDASQVSEGQDADATREYVAELVTTQVACDGFCLQPDQVLLLSARNALLSRRILIDGWPKAGEATGSDAHAVAVADTRARFAQLAFGRFASPSAISPEAAMAAAHALLEDSGVPELEAQVLGHLYSHSESVKSLALVDDLQRLLSEVRNMCASCAAALTTGVESLETRTCALRTELSTTLQAFDDVNVHADAIAAGVTTEVQAHLQTLRGRLFSHIINVLDTSPRSTPTSSNSNWQRVRERFLSIFTLPRTHAVPGAAPGVHAQMGASFSAEKDALLAAAGSVVARSRSKAELATLLAQLHEDITQQIHAEVTEFWSVLEAVASSRHSELLSVLNKHLASLSAKVESAVSCSLNVSLSPVSLAMAPKDVNQFHCSLEALIAAGVIESRERHIRVNEREVPHRVQRHGGICRWGSYWETTSQKRTVVEAYTMSVFEIRPTEIADLLVSQVDAAISSTESQLSAFVSKFVTDQLCHAREQLERYSDSYLSTMSNALEVGQKGAEHRQAALHKVQALQSRVNTLFADVQALTNAAERKVHHAREPIIAFDEFEELDGAAGFTQPEEQQSEQEEAQVQEQLQSQGQ